MTDQQSLALRDHMQLGDVFYKSGLFADLKSAAQAIVKIQAGAELGIPPFASMSGISIIQGKPAIGAGLIAGLIKASTKYNYKIKRHDDEACVIEFYEGGELIGESAFTMEDAKQAGLVGRPIWRSYPRNMLFSRAMSNGARWYTPDLFTGPVYTPEELGGDSVDAEYREADAASGMVGGLNMAEEAQREVERIVEDDLDGRNTDAQAEPWWKNETARKRFWAKAHDEYDLDHSEVHKALSVDSLKGWEGTEDEAYERMAVYAKERAEAAALADSVGGEVA